MLPDPYSTDHGLTDDPPSVETGPADNPTVEGEVQIDLPNYISNYQGYIHYQRLFFIAQRCPSLRHTALRLAHDYIKRYTLDTASYNKVFLMLAEEQAGPAAQSSSALGESLNDIHRGMINGVSNVINEQLPNTVSIPGAGEVMTSGPTLSDGMRQALMNVMAGKNDAKLVYDTQWEESSRRSGTILLDQLDTELKNYKANSIKESIRRGTDDLGDLYLKLGQLANARKCYMRSRDYCTCQQQEINMCLNVIKIAIFQRAWSQVSAHVTRAYGLSELRDVPLCTTSPGSTYSQQRTRPGFGSRAAAMGTARTVTSGRTTSEGLTGAGIPTSSPDPLSSRAFARQHSDGAGTSGGQGSRDAMARAPTQLAIAAGLVELAARNFRGAAMSFLQVNPDHCESPTSSIVTQSDLAYFITLCTLATFDRTELVSQVLNSPCVRLLLEAEPSCREILYSFHHADYASCLGRINKLSNVLRLDYFLADHVTTLCWEIRSRAICQYFSPYSCADLNRMAKAFDTTVTDLENELAVLIQDGSIKGRIDSHKQLLRALNVDERCLTFARALRLVDEYKKRTQAMVLRMSLVRQRLTCQGSREESDMLNYLT
ncbi:COP9/signalosome complex subunit Csn1 [Clonorchis sinensis]|uniref:COP9/signalosome complex subunit Csn1 n=1 Tax=Clonorchis sinensis TaxID=79923 RepID=A0A8T1MI33_CLOSI|nr:COP9/signalosome complex subunit Csn1 [Clonorchis sinensis]